MGAVAGAAISRPTLGAEATGAAAAPRSRAVTGAVGAIGAAGSAVPLN